AQADGLARGLAELPLPHRGLATNECAHRPALHLAAGEGGPSRLAADPGVLDDALGFEIDDGEVGVVAHSDAALAGNAEDALGTGAGQVDEAGKAEAPGIHVIEHH